MSHHALPLTGTEPTDAPPTSPGPTSPGPTSTEAVLQRLLVGHAWPWVLLWIVSRGWMLRQWQAHYGFIGNDVAYYVGQLSQSGGYPVILREYPLPMVWLLDALRLPTNGDTGLYLVVFALLMAVLDAGFSVWLWRGQSRVAAVYWMLFTFCMGPLVWFRYDLLAGVVVGAAVFLVARRPAASGALVALGAGIKLWPALLLASLLGAGRSARRRVVAFTLTGLALALGSLASGGLARLLSPLAWQSGRGLQIESIWASPPMWLRAFGSAGRQQQWLVQMSAYNAFEVYGPWVDVLLKLASLAMVLGVVFAGVVAALCWRREVSADVRALACLAIVLVMVVANKTLSPQYLAWVGAVSAAWLGLAPRGRERTRAAVVALACLALAAATQYVYPMRYGGLISGVPAEPRVTAVLVLRNLGLVALTGLTCTWTLLALLRSRRFAPPLATPDTIGHR